MEARRGGEVERDMSWKGHSAINSVRSSHTLAGENRKSGNEYPYPPPPFPLLPRPVPCHSACTDFS